MEPRSASKNVALVRTVIEMLNRGDWDAVITYAAPDFEYDLTRTLSPMAGVYRRDQMRGIVDEFLGQWETARYEPREFIELGDLVVTPFTVHVAGRDGIELQTEAAWVWTFRGDELVRLCLYQDRGEALADAETGQDG